MNRLKDENTQLKEIIRQKEEERKKLENYLKKLATEFVIQQGHKKIALVTGHLQEDGVMQKRYRGFLKAIEQNGLEFQKENLFLNSYYFLKVIGYQRIFVLR